MRYLVRYPSDRMFEVTGEYKLCPVGDWLTPAVLLTSGEVALLDPRAVVNLLGAEIYSPRRNLDGLSPEMAEWLLKHPEWPANFDEFFGGDRDWGRSDDS